MHTPTRIQRLKQRQTIIRTLREELFNESFLELETPLLVKATCPDPYIDSIQTEQGYLITSTEYQIKRLMAEGLEKVFTLTKNFRANDSGRYHSVEFTMLEWARAFEPLSTIESDVQNLIQKAFKKLYPESSALPFGDCSIEVMGKTWDSLTVRDAFAEYLHLKDLEDFSLKPLAAAVKSAKIDVPQQCAQDEQLMISFLLDQLQSHLGKSHPLFLKEWPSYLTSSAPPTADSSCMTERTELYIGGIELANGFPFLRDAQLQRQLFHEALEIRHREGRPAVVIDELYLNALEKLPPGAGMALGVDRLVMLLSNASTLTDVQTFSWEEL